MLMNYYRNIDREKIQFDFLTHRAEKGAYEDEIISLGGRVYHAPRLYPQNYPQYFRWMSAFFKAHLEYQVVHSHIDAMSYFPLRAAQKAGIPVRIAHSHSSKLDRDFKLPIKFFALKSISTVANCNCACGEHAGKFMFGHSDFKIIHNAIDIDRFSFNAQMRKKKREEMNLSDKFVIGHVGRYCYIKNQLFLVDVFLRIKKKCDNAYLLLVGKGEDEAKIRKRIQELNLEDSISLLMDREDVNELYQVMDIFVMPSLFEGLPLVGVEAQANGLPCIVSDSISEEVLITSNIKMLSLKRQAQEWAQEVIKTNTERNLCAREEIIRAGYDIKKEVKNLEKWYLSLSDDFEHR